MRGEPGGGNSTAGRSAQADGSGLREPLPMKLAGRTAGVMVLGQTQVGRWLGGAGCLEVRHGDVAGFSPDPGGR